MCAEDSDAPYMFSLQVSSGSASRLTAKPFLTMAKSYFPAADEKASGRVKIQVEDETVILEFFDVSKSAIPLCSFEIKVTAEALVMDDKELTMDSFLAQMTNYAETARLTESTPGVYFNVSDDLDFARFFSIISGMSSAGISRILVSSYENERSGQSAPRRVKIQMTTRTQTP